MYAYHLYSLYEKDLLKNCQQHLEGVVQLVSLRYRLQVIRIAFCQRQGLSSDSLMLQHISINAKGFCFGETKRTYLCLVEVDGFYEIDTGIHKNFRAQGELGERAISFRLHHYHFGDGHHQLQLLQDK